MRKITITVSDSHSADFYEVLSALGVDFTSIQLAKNGIPVTKQTPSEQPKKTPNKKFNHPSGKTQHVLAYGQFQGQAMVSYETIQAWMKKEGMSPTGHSSVIGKCVKAHVADRVGEVGHRKTHVNFKVTTPGRVKAITEVQ